MWNLVSWLRVIGHSHNPNAPMLSTYEYTFYAVSFPINHGMLVPIILLALGTIQLFITSSSLSQKSYSPIIDLPLFQHTPRPIAH